MLYLSKQVYFLFEVSEVHFQSHKKHLQKLLSSSHQWFSWNAVPFFCGARKTTYTLHIVLTQQHIPSPASYQPCWPYWLKQKNMMTGSSLNSYLHGVWSCLWGICNRARSVDLLRAVDHLSEVLLRGSGWRMWISSTLSGEESDIWIRGVFYQLTLGNVFELLDGNKIWVSVWVQAASCKSFIVWMYVCSCTCVLMCFSCMLKVHAFTYTL